MSRLFLCLLLITLYFNATQAQISPGELSRFHKDLEGITNCTKCHDLGETVSEAKCLGCHTSVQARIKAGKGYHSSVEVKKSSCRVCHSEHHERSFDLIFFKDGESKFDHALTGARHEGRHAKLKCRDCHRREFQVDYPALADDNLNHDRTFLGLDGDNCLSCHRDEHGGQTSNKCLDCHNYNEWRPAAKFNHKNTKFPLTGKHTSVECVKCHPLEKAAPPQFTAAIKLEDDDGFASRFSDIEHGNCIACHKDEHEGKFGRECQSCHTTDGFRSQVIPKAFNHDDTGSPLVGAHQTVDCSQCHVDGRFAGTPQDCWSCHEEDYRGVQDPNHLAGQFDHNCSTCHSNDAFSPSTFNHDDTGFPLAGAHQEVICSQCHVDGRFAGTPQDCWSCHEENYRGVQDPNHETGQFDHDCSICHSNDAFTPAIFDHSQTDFPLTGGHQDVDCAQCHVGGRYAGTPTDCWACHFDDYAGARDPDHRAGFPHDCEQCHDTDGWQGANFDHDAAYFPIYSGRHREEWDACSDCHTNANNYAVFSCFACHPRNRTDAQHEDEINYRYDSAACYDCHPRGRVEDLVPDYQPPVIQRH